MKILGLNAVQFGILALTAIGVFFTSTANDFLSLGVPEAVFHIVTSAITASLGLLAAVNTGTKA